MAPVLGLRAAPLDALGMTAIARAPFIPTPKNFPIITDNDLVMDEVGDAEPRVRRVLPELAPIPVPVWLATHGELHTSRRIRVVFDLLADELGRSAPA